MLQNNKSGEDNYIILDILNSKSGKDKDKTKG
ncbi:MAG: hypothetical protein RL613_1141 [Fusobacteriota bacterium]|jgi:hypothetical protein